MQIKATHLLSSELSPSQVLHVYLKSPIHPAGIKSDHVLKVDSTDQ